MVETESQDTNAGPVAPFFLAYNFCLTKVHDVRAAEPGGEVNNIEVPHDPGIACKDVKGWNNRSDVCCEQPLSKKCAPENPKEVRGAHMRNMYLRK